MMRRYAQLPSVVNGYPLDNQFSIVVPVARTNLISNPSVETNTTGWGTVVAGSIARTTAQQYHGAYSLAVTPSNSANDGAAAGPVALAAGQLYAVSCKFLGNAGRRYLLHVATTLSVSLQSYAFTATGRWQWVWLYYLEPSTISRLVLVTKNNDTNTTTFYLDGMQVEALASAAETVSTYIDGDQQGLVVNQQPPAYLWNGTPHASTSVRSGLTRAGGMVVPLKNYSFLLTAIAGLGLALPQNVKTEYARIDGAYDDYTRKPTRQFTLAGQFQGRSYAELRDQRGQVARLLDRDLVGLDQRMTLLHQIVGPCGDVQTNTARVLCKYAGGLDGNTDNQALENAAIAFEQYLPVVASDGEQGSSLSVQQNVTNANTIAYRSPSGVWSALGSGAASGSVMALARGLDGTIYVGGDFPAMGGVASTNSIAAWNPATGVWSAVGTGATAGAGVDAIAVGPDGSVYASGSFTQMGGVANTSRIAKYNPGTGNWSALSTGANGEVRALAIASNGDLYAAGDFTLMAGVANTAAIARWNGSAWSALSTGLDAGGYALAFDKAGNLFVGGQFGTAGGVTAPRVAKWNGSAFTALTTTATGTVDALAFGPSGLLYVGGTFATIGGITGTSRVAQYNGTSFQPLGVGVSNTVNALAVDASGLLHVGGQFATAGGITLPDSFARWNGATWLTEDVNLPGAALVLSILPQPDGSQYIGFTTTGTAVAASNTTVTNNGTARTYPTLRINGPSSGTSRIYQIVNYTTGRVIYLNYTINAGEVATLRFTPDSLSFQSTFQGNIANTILPGSNEADFFLQPGANIISFYAADSTVTAALYWRPQFASLDDIN